MFSSLLQILRIDVKDFFKRRQSYSVQLLISVITLVEALRITLDLLAGNPVFSRTVLGGQLVGLLALTAVCLYLVQRGRPILAAHIYLTVFNLSVLGLILISGTLSSTYPYLFLISIVAIAGLDSIRASLIYSAATAVAITILFATTATDPFTHVNIILTMGTISVTAWLTASVMHQAIDESRRLNKEIEIHSQNTYRRYRQLQLGAEVSQLTSQSLDPRKLLRDAVYLIRDQFDFYHVSIFLMQADKQNLILEEATGRIGDTLKTKKFQIPLNSNSVVSWAAQNQKARIVNNVDEEPTYFREPLLAETHSEMALPLMARGELLGVLDVQSREVDAFSEDDIAILQIMANQIAVNLDNAHLFAKTERQLSETESLFNFNRMLASSMDPNEIYRRSARAFCRELPAAACVISSWDAAVGEITTQAEYISQLAGNQFSQVQVTGLSLSIDSLPNVAQVVESGSPVLERVEGRHAVLPTGVGGADWETAVCVHIPLLYGNETVGIAHIFRSGDGSGFSPEDIKFAQTMANETAVAIENALLTTEAQARVAQLNMLNRISSILSLSPTLHDVFEGARREILSLVDATGMSIVLLTENKTHLQWAYGFEYGQELDLEKFPLLPVTQGFSGHVIRTRQYLHINSQINKAAEEYKSLTIGAEPNSWLGLPMIVTNEIIGVLIVENAEDPDAFTQRDIDLMQTIVGPLAITIHNMLQYQRLQLAYTAQEKQRLQLKTAAEVAATAASALELEDLIQQAVSLIKERFQLYYVGLFMIDDEGKTAVLRAATGKAGQIQLQNKHSLGVGSQSLIGGATADGKPRITQDVTLDKEWQRNPHLPETRAELALPLRVRGRIIGALTVQSTQPNYFEEELINTLFTMADQLAIAIDNVQLISEAEARANTQRKLNEISAQMHRSGNVEEIVRIGLEALSQQLKDAEAIITLGQHNS
jgi:GAF domain-containing protein